MSGSGYDFFSRLLHRVALGSNSMAEMSFDLENSLVKNKIYPDDHVFISGLARSGTTVLLQYLYDTGKFRSLTYRDMPFVLMPGIWKTISPKKQIFSRKERAHLDGIMIGSDSPEAFEEVFWQVFSSKEYILNDRLKLYQPNVALAQKFKAYINHILVTGESDNQIRYLSKNNNNVLRLPFLQKNFPGSTIIIPFREPLQHANSLLNQHLHFSAIQQEDHFTLEYMNWLGHFEFGLNQRSFFLNDEDNFDQMQHCFKKDIDFWLLTWKNYYQYVINQPRANMLFFSYDKFCLDPSTELNRLFLKIRLKQEAPALKPFMPANKNAGNFSENLLEQCSLLYRMLRNEAV